MHAYSSYDPERRRRAIERGRRSSSRGHQDGARPAGPARTARSRGRGAPGKDGRRGAAGSSAEALRVEESVILVDTNAWIHHLRKADQRLVRFLGEQRVRTCDVVIGELL